MAVSDLTARDQNPNSSQQTIRLIVADDSSVYRDGLANLLSMQRDFHVVGTADTPSGAADIIRETRPDIVLLGWAASSPGLLWHRSQTYLDRTPAQKHSKGACGRILAGSGYHCRGDPQAGEKGIERI